jgi:hypothetical protein
MIKVIKWSLYDLGEAYNFTHIYEDILDKNTGEQIDVKVTYIRLLFSFPLSDTETLETLNQNSILYGTINEFIGFFTSDITIFPSSSLPKLKEGIHEELMGLLHSNSDDYALKSYLSWFIRNVDTNESQYVDIPLDAMSMMEDLVNKNGTPIQEIYKRLPNNSDLKNNVYKKYREFLDDI